MAADLIFVFIIIFIPLIIIHEFGHFIACKMVGISVMEFGIGFPPRIATLFRWGETDFTLNAIPLGGFVMPFGEDMVRPQGEEGVSSARQQLLDRGVENPKSVFDANPWQKLWFLFAGPLANFVGALLIFIIVPLTGFPRPVFDVAITDVYPDSEAALRALRQGDVVTAVNGQTFDTSSDLEETLQSILEATPEAPVIFSIHRPLTDQRFDVELTAANLDQEQAEQRVRILEVQSNTPAAEAGFLANDIILQVNDTEISELADMQEITQDNENVEIRVLIERDQAQQEILVTPRTIEREDSPDYVGIGITINYVVFAPAFGFVVDDVDETLRYYNEYYTLPEAVEFGVNRFSTAMSIIASFPVEIARGNITLQEARPVSPVGVSQIGVQIIENNPYQDFLDFMALISITLAITNLLPIPGLDGGRILFVVVELLRGKPLPPEREGLVHLIGVGLVLVLGIAVLIYDIINPFEIIQ